MSDAIMHFGKTRVAVRKVCVEPGRHAASDGGYLGGAGNSAPIKAVYQLLVKPISGTFVFMRRKNLGAGERPEEPSGQELALFIQEGTRRHDELQRARAKVPDGCRLKPTGAEPRPRPDEEDPALFRRAWNRASSGATADECEADSPADAYQIRLLLARWVEDEALVTQ